MSVARTAVSVLVTGIVGVLVAGCTSSPSDLSPSVSTPTVVSSAPADEAAAVTEALRALPQDPVRAAATSASISPAQARAALPPGTKVAPASDTWAPDGTGSGGTISMTVTLPGREPTSYLAVMVREGDRWKVLATLEADTAKAKK